MKYEYLIHVVQSSILAEMIFRSRLTIYGLVLAPKPYEVRCYHDSASLMTMLKHRNIDYLNRAQVPG